jgi:hypothetical protein
MLLRVCDAIRLINLRFLCFYSIQKYTNTHIQRNYIYMLQLLLQSHLQVDYKSYFLPQLFQQ